MSSEDIVSETLEIQEQTIPEAELDTLEAQDAESKPSAEAQGAAAEPEIDFSKPPARVAKPDKNELMRAVEQLQAETKKLQEAQSNAQKELEELSSSKSGNREEFDQALQTLKALQIERNRINNERQQLIAQRNTTRDALNKSIQEDKSLRSEVKYSSAAAVDEEIAKLEQKQQRVSMSLAEEKKIIKQIADLKQSKRMVMQLAEQKNTITQVRENKAGVDKRLNEKTAELKAVTARMDEQRAIMDRLKEGTQSNKDRYPEIRGRITNLRAQIKEKYAQINKLYEDFREADQKFNAYRKVLRRYREHEKKAQEERRKAEYEAKQKAIEEEEAKRIPYEAEILLCDYLVHYLESFLSNKAESSASEAAESKLDLELDGQMLHAYRRDDEDDLSNKKKKGKKSKKQISGVKHDRIVHTVDTLGTFSALGIAAPITVQDVPACVDAVKAKKAWYQQQPRGSVPTIRELVKGETAAQNGASDTPAEGASAEQPRARKGKKGRDFTHEEMDFPEIPGSRPGAAPAAGLGTNFAAALLTTEHLPVVGEEEA